MNEKVKDILEWILCIVIALVLALLIRYYIGTPPIAKYENKPTNVWEGFVHNVLEWGKESYIKRVIALPGEHVEIKEEKVYINGEELKEDYLQPGVVTNLGEAGVYSDFIVPENSVFAMGDNRTQSTDCRVFGCIPLEKIEGKILIT